MATVGLLHLLKTMLVIYAVKGGGGHRFGHNHHVNADDSIGSSSIDSPMSSSSLSSPTNEAFSSTASSLLSEDRLYRMRERSRRHRMESIRYEILRRLGMDRPPSVNITQETRDKAMENFPGLFQPQPIIERRCYSASCNIPDLVDKTLWSDDNSLGLRLYIPVPLDRDNGVDLQSAFLRLFLKLNPTACSCPCLEEEAQEGRHCMSGLLVSVYQFIRPLSIRRRNKVVNKRRLLDAKFVPAFGNAWVSLNIDSVVREWRRNRRNFGLEVTVKDDNDTEIDAKRLFVPPDCNVGREVGCPEDISENVRAISPWFVYPWDNFPYVDTSTTVREPTRSRSRRLRARRSAEHRIAVSVTGVTPGSTSQTTNQTSSCKGKDVVIKVTDENVIQPKSFTTLVCPTASLDCENGQCKSRPCSPPETQPVTGVYKMENGQTVSMTLPLTKIVRCGC